MQNKIITQFLTHSQFTKKLKTHPNIKKYLSKKFYKYLKYKTKEGIHVIIANKEIPKSKNIHRDDSWKRRKEIAKTIEFLDEAKATTSKITSTKGFRDTILLFINQSYQEAFEEEKSNSELLAIFYKNSQRIFDERIQKYANGAEIYEVARYAELGVFDEKYSHIQHFSWIYWQQIQAILELLEETNDILRIVDLGAGGCNFIISAANYLKELDCLHRVHFVAIDKSERDMQFGSAMLKSMDGVNIEFEVDDVTANGFAYRLIKLKPDLIVSNHLLEHLPGELKNLYLHDWLLATKNVLSISVPLKDKLEESLSEHLHYFDADSVKSLAQSMELRSGYAIRVRHLDYIKQGGLINFKKTTDLRKTGDLSAEIIELRPKKIVVKPSEYYDDFNLPFDLVRFKTSKKALKIATIQDQCTFSRKGDFPRQIRQLLIKLKGTNDVLLPANFEQLREAIQLIINHNQSINSKFEECYAYLNVFRGMTEFNSYRGLSLTCHGDQLQGLNEIYWYKPDYSYIVSSTLPTTFWEQAFDFSEAMADFKNGKQVNLYDYMKNQAKGKNIYHSDNFGIYLLSPYIVHSASLAQEETFRVFMKIAFSTKRFFDNRELRRNPAFNIKNWYQQETIGHTDGWLQHGHFNERFLKEDIIRLVCK